MCSRLSGVSIKKIKPKPTVSANKSFNEERVYGTGEGVERHAERSQANPIIVRVVPGASWWGLRIPKKHRLKKK
jgi:hypothetical protein